MILQKDLTFGVHLLTVEEALNKPLCTSKKETSKKVRSILEWWIISRSWGKKNKIPPLIKIGSWLENDTWLWILTTDKLTWINTTNWIKINDKGEIIINWVNFWEKKQKKLIILLEVMSFLDFSSEYSLKIDFLLYVLGVDFEYIPSKEQWESHLKLEKDKKDKKKKKK